MTLRLRQICLVAPVLEPAVQALQGLFGLPVCHRDPAVGAYGLENALFVFGHQFVEVVAPLHDGMAAGRFVQRSGGLGGYMAIFDTHDPERRHAHVQALGVRVAHVLDHPGFRGIQLHPRDCRAAMLEFDRTQGNDDIDGAYAPAGPHWQRARRTDLARGLPLVDMGSPQPDDLAAHWARIIDVPLQQGDDGAPQLRFDLGALRFVPGAVERLQTLHVAVADPAAVLAAAQAGGLDVGADGVALCGVRWRLRTV